MARSPYVLVQGLMRSRFPGRRQGALDEASGPQAKPGVGRPEVARYPESALPRRVAVVGVSGAGKSHLAARLAGALGVPHVELDAIFHQPGWTPLERGEFRRRVAERLHGDGFVIDGNYSTVRDLVWGAADTVVWLDYPRRRVMVALARRTLGRMLLRRELWNGNRERPRDVLRLWDAERSIVAWAWTRHSAYVERYQAAMADPANARLEFVRLRSRREADAWLERVAASRDGSS